MTAVDEWLEGMLAGGGVTMLLLVSLLLGLRHASDPDHLAAVTTLIASEGRRRARTAARLGLLWGLGHGTTLVLVGLPIVVLGGALPEAAQQAAEVAIGLVIIALAARLLARWRRGAFHAHEHEHGAQRHRHLHSHRDDRSHEHLHHAAPRTPLASYFVGVVHGIGGSGGVTVLLLAATSDDMAAAGALLLFAAGTAVSMTFLSTVFGLAVVGGPTRHRLERLAPAMGVAGMAFGAWYALGALELVPYPL